MGFDIFLMHFENGKPSGVSRDVVRRIFGEAVVPEEDHVWRLQYCDEKEFCLAYLDPEDKTHLVWHMMIARPVASAHFWQSIYDLLHETGFVRFIPGNCPPLVAKESVIEHLTIG